MLQAMNTGHDGSLSTVHANSTRDALSRLETMMLHVGHLAARCGRCATTSPRRSTWSIHLARLSDGTRKVLRLTEVVGMEEDVVTTQDIFVFEQEGIDKDGRVIGHHRATGVRPKFTDRLRRAGIELRPDMFDPTSARRRADAAGRCCADLPARGGPHRRHHLVLRGRPVVSASVSGGVVRGTRREGDLLRVEAGRGADGEPRLAALRDRLARLADQAGHPARPIPSSSHRRLRLRRLRAGIGCGRAGSLGDRGGRRRGLRSSRASSSGSGRSASSSSRHSSPTRST